MPANLPPQYYELERVYKSETDPSEKLRLAKELLSMMPKHKGTDKLQADLKAKIAKHRKELEGGSSHKGGGARQVAAPDSITREGAGLAVLIGPPNSGKSSLLDILTNAEPLVADYPYSTREPQTGMMPYETVQIQLLDTPPISADQKENYLPSLIRQGDLIIVVIDVTLPGFEDRIKLIFDWLEEKRVKLVPQLPEKTDDVLNSYKRTIFAAHKFLDEGGDAGLEKLTSLYPDYKIVPTSILDDDVIEEFRRSIFESMQIIRVYTKPVGKDPDFNDPIILPIGGTVEDAAFELHKDFAHKLQFAKIWGHGKFEGQRVKNSYVLTDGDIIEFHI